MGNSDGEGRPGLTGASTAAPLMFEAFNLLPESPWFAKPVSSLRSVQLCEVTGFSPSQHCPTVDAELPVNAGVPELCEMHQQVYLNAAGERSFRDCATGKLVDTVWFNLDPIAGYFYRQNHSRYQPLPPFSDDCNHPEEKVLDIVYPQPGTDIIAPRGFSG